MLISLWLQFENWDKAAHCKLNIFINNINGGADAAVKDCYVSNLLNWANQFSYICVLAEKPWNPSGGGWDRCAGLWAAQDYPQV